MLEAGTYLATIRDHSISQTQKGDPQVVVNFTVDAPTGQQKITWYGSFSEKATQYTVKNLITMGLKGNNPAGDLEIGKQVEIVVEHELDQQKKWRAKVKFINTPGAVRNQIPQDLAKAKLSALEGAVMAARQSIGATASIADDSDEIPF